MASTRQIKSRIRSVSSNKQITKAMELVASSKLRKAQEKSLQTRRFTETALQVLAALSKTTDVKQSPLFDVRPVKTRLVIVLSSDRGLAGAYNANVLKQLAKRIRQNDEAKVKTKVVTIGRKASQFVSKLSDVDSEGSYTVAEDITVDELRPILNYVIGLYRRHEIDAVDLITTRFVNSFTQTAEIMQLLPAGVEEVEGVEAPNDLLFEPSPEEVLDYVAIRLVEAHLYQAALDARASEHAMRRVAMKNASDNASDIVDALTLEMNKVRQAAITQELSEISAGVEAVK